MDNSELRLNNYIQLKKDDPNDSQSWVRVDSLGFAKINNQHESLYSGIELTSRLLVCCGAMQLSKTCYLYKTRDRHLPDIHIHFLNGHGVCITSDEHYLYLSRRMVYLHQFQNLLLDQFGEGITIDFKREVPEHLSVRVWNVSPVAWLRRIIKWNKRK